MFYKMINYSSRYFKTCLIAAMTLAILTGVKWNASARENRFQDDNRHYDNRDVPYNNYNRGRGGYGDRYNSSQRGRGNGYFVENIKENPAAYGAEYRYMNDDWAKGYLYWAPNGFNNQQLRPLVISLHGNGEDVEDAFARLYYTVKQYNYAFVAPQWQSGAGTMTPREISTFIDGIISEVNEKEGINMDPGMVILHGYERGANMAGYLAYYNPGYVMVIVDSGPFPAIMSASDAGSVSSGDTLSIPADELNKLAGGYIYLYSRYEDQSMYQKLEETRQILVAAGVNADLNYTKRLLPGEFSESLSKSIIGMFDRAAAGK